MTGGQSNREPTLTGVTIREVGPRDGLQMEPLVPLPAKLRWLEQLVATGVRRIEATAFVSPAAVPAMADAAQVAQFVVERFPSVHWSCLVPNREGARRAVAAGIANIEYVVSASDGHSLANSHQTTSAAVSAIREIANIAHDGGGTCEVIIATAWDCPFDGPTPVQRSAAIAREAVASGADELCLGDTIGTTTPVRVIELIQRITADNPGVPLGGHFHNTRGSGIASAYAAVGAGLTRLDSSIGGLGGCPFAPGASGNIATEELAYLLDECGIPTGLNSDALMRAAAATERLVGHPLDSSYYRAGGRPTPLTTGAQSAKSSA